MKEKKSRHSEALSDELYPSQAPFNELYQIAWPELSTFLLNELPVNISLIDTEGYIAWGNQRMLSTLNLNSLNQFVGKHISTWDKPNEIRWEYCKKVIESGKEVTTEESFGDAHYLSIRKPIKDDDKIRGVLDISIDITERKQNEIKLKVALENAEAANEAKVEFLQNMRHDIRTPLTGIMGFANIIKDRVTDPDIKKDVDILIESSESLLNLLNEILELIKVTSGKMPLYKKKFNLESKLIEVIKINHAKAASKGLSLSFFYDKNIPAELLGDPDRIHRIVLELITNAIKFTQVGSVILSTNLIKETKQSVIIKITVEDTGIGMTEDQQQDIFIQFKRLNPSYQGIYKGTGLGLTLVRQLMEEIEGEIEIESNPSQGTAFTCIIAFKKTLWGTTEICTNIREIPINEKSPTPQQEQISRIKVKKERPTPYRILVVEDQSIAALFLKNMLTGLNCEVDVAPTGNMGKELAKNNSYDLIFMDIGLPDIDGLEVTRRIRADKLSKSQGLPIIAVTAHEDEKNAEHCLKAGMNEVYIKPLSREQAKLLFNKYIDSLAER